MGSIREPPANRSLVGRIASFQGFIGAMDGAFGQFSCELCAQSSRPTLRVALQTSIAGGTCFRSGPHWIDNNISRATCSTQLRCCRDAAIVQISIRRRRCSKRTVHNLALHQHACQPMRSDCSPSFQCVLRNTLTRVSCSPSSLCNTTARNEAHWFSIGTATTRRQSLNPPSSRTSSHASTQSTNHRAH